MLLKVICTLLLIHIVSTNSYPFGNSLEFNESDHIVLSKIKKNVDYRLSPFIIPENYKITLTPYFDENPEKQLTFDGEVAITLQIKKELPEIIIHSRELNFTNKQVVLRRTSDNKIINTLIESDPERDFKFIKPVSSTKLSSGQYVLTIEYVGLLNNAGSGFHRSSYVNEKGEKIWLAATQFESVGARRAFPCFDEPKLKATFDITIRHQPHHYALSNMPIKTSNLVDAIKKTTFHTTPVMPTYLIAFVVSDFKEMYKNNNFRVHARPNAIQNGKLAVETGEKLLHALEDFTGIQFEISKMDQIAIPGKGGAMENWGLVTYGEDSLLYNEKTISTAQKQSIVETIAHEFAHQWFGDLVTPKWWKYLWLKEGFASFFQSYITHQVEPAWQSVNQAVVSDIQTRAFDLDSSDKTHPVDQDVGSPAEIQSLYDSISYQKGGAIIRMMQHFLGNDVFKRGLNIYLKENGYSATESADLFKALDKSVAQNKSKLGYELRTIMHSWTNCKGYPVVTVTRNYEDPGLLRIKQQRFVSYNATEQEINECVWYIPINYARKTNTNFEDTSLTSWMNESSNTLRVTAESDEWILLNKQQTGFYRVNYDEKNWQLIINHLKSKKYQDIHVLNRAQLMNDALAFVKQGSLKLLTLLRLTSYLSDETDYIAWVPALKIYSWLKSKLAATEYYPFFEEYVLHTTRKFVESVGYEESAEDGHIDKLKRVKAIQWACSHGDKNCIEHMKTNMEKWINEPEKTFIAPDYQKITICQGLRTSGFNLWKKIFEKCLGSKDNQERSILTEALSCSNNKEILQYYLNYTLQENSLLDNTVGVISYILANTEIGVDVTLDFVTKRFVSLLLKYKDEKKLTSLYTNIGQRITAKYQLEKIIATKDRDIPESITIKGIDAAKMNVQWLEQNKAEMQTWMKEFIATNNSY